MHLNLIPLKNPGSRTGAAASAPLDLKAYCIIRLYDLNVFALNTQPGLDMPLISAMLTPEPTATEQIVTPRIEMKQYLNAVLFSISKPHTNIMLKPNSAKIVKCA